MANRPNTIPDAEREVPHAQFIDPTPNVIALVEANARTADELRKADTKFNDAQVCHLKEIGVLRAVNAETLRISDLDRLGKTREVDVTTAAAQAAAIATAVQTLAVASDKNAEAIRSQLNADRAALAKQVTDTAATLSANNDSANRLVATQIAELQKSQYQGVGKSSVADPMMAEFVSEMRMLIKHQATGVGKSEGLSQGWAILGGAILLALAIYSGVFKTAPPAPIPVLAPAPQVIVVPSPGGGVTLPVTPPQR